MMRVCFGYWLKIAIKKILLVVLLFQQDNPSNLSSKYGAIYLSSLSGAVNLLMSFYNLICLFFFLYILNYQL